MRVNPTQPAVLSTEENEGRGVFFNSDGCQMGLRYRFAHASRRKAAQVIPIIENLYFGGLGELPDIKPNRELPL